MHCPTYIARCSVRASATLKHNYNVYKFIAHAQETRCPPDVPNAARSSPANPVAVVVAALGSGSVQTKSTTNFLTHGMKACKRAKAKVSITTASVTRCILIANQILLLICNSVQFKSGTEKSR